MCLCVSACAISVYLTSVVVQCNRSISELFIEDCSLHDTGLSVLGKCVEVSEIWFCIACGILFIVNEYTDVHICADTQTHSGNEYTVRRVFCTGASQVFCLPYGENECICICLIVCWCMVRVVILQ